MNEIVNLIYQNGFNALFFFISGVFCGFYLCKKFFLKKEVTIKQLYCKIPPKSEVATITFENAKPKFVNCKNLNKNICKLSNQKCFFYVKQN